VDYIPSRGAVNNAGDTWASLDGSFKQYAYAQGMDLKAAVPLDAPALVEQIKAGATVNEAEGWAQNLDSAALQTALADYQNRIKAYIDSQKPDTTVGDVLGAKAIVTQNYPILMGTLPYQTVAEGNPYLNDNTEADHNARAAEIFHQIALGWWAEKFAFNKLLGAMNRVVHYQLPSHALAGSPLSVRYFFGVARSAPYGSRVMDAKEDFISAVHSTGDREQRR
jgi:hypothetical protein